MYVAPKTITFKLTTAEEEYIGDMSRNIFYNGYHHGRSLDEIYNSTRNGKILEFALCRQGGTLNPHDFDKSDPNSYGWDVSWYGQRAEVKRMYFGDMSGWLVVSEQQVETFRKMVRMQNIVDIFIIGDYTEDTDSNITARWFMIGPADTFNKCLRPASSKYKTNYDSTGKLKLLYNHNHEPRTIIIKEKVFEPNA